MTDWLWLVSLVGLTGFAAGWWLSRRRVRQSGLQQRGQFSASYVEGMNYLLNEQPDRAIDVLVSMVEVDSEAVETHLALGTLFRNQGEVERAIRIHQNLIARPTLSKGERSKALMNLGLDYKQAGLNDRAVVLFEQLVQESHPGKVKALESLLEIYQHEKEWLRAIAVSRKLQADDAVNQTHLIGHFYAELAEAALEGGDLRGAAKMVRQIRGLAPQSPRYLLLELRLAKLRGKQRLRLRWLDAIINYCPDYRLQVLDDLESYYLESNGESELVARLLELAADPDSGAQLVCQIAEKIRKIQDDEAAVSLLEEHVNRTWSPLLQAKLLSLRELGGVAGEGTESRKLAAELLEGLTLSAGHHRCGKCGFEAREHHWRCPTCGAWESIQYKEVDRWLVHE